MKITKDQQCSLPRWSQHNTISGDAARWGGGGYGWGEGAEPPVIDFSYPVISQLALVQRYTFHAVNQHFSYTVTTVSANTDIS